LLLLAMQIHSQFLTSTVIISFFLLPSFSTLFFIGAFVIVQLIKNSHYIWTQNKKKILYAYTHVITTPAWMLTIRMRYADEIKHVRRLPTIPNSLRSCDARQTKHIGNTVLVLQDIARLSSRNLLKIFAHLAKHSQTKLLAIQGTIVPYFQSHSKYKSKLYEINACNIGYSIVTCFHGNA
jgi:hypothetical protein